jgi:Fe-S-cluster containining protein
MTDNLKVLNNKKPWFSEGLRFKCTQCGKCCTGFPGFTWVSEEESRAIAGFLEITVEEFIATFTRRVLGKLALKEVDPSWSCVFLKDNRCSIYPVRPKQCRTFPWWVQNLASKEAWELAASMCEGINHPEGELVSCEKIVEAMK